MRQAQGIHKAFAELLERYHGTLDLLSTEGLRDIQRLIDESVAYAEVIEELAGPTPSIVDVGSGAGLPGVIVAASLPKAQVLLVERRRRRGAFLELAASRLGLDNVSVIKRDVRNVRDICADVVTAQAVAGLADVVRLTRHLHADPCFLVSRRGPDWMGELSGLRTLLNGDAAFTVPIERRLDHRGSLVALRLTGGPACRSSGS